MATFPLPFSRQFTAIMDLDHTYVYRASVGIPSIASGNWDVIILLLVYALRDQHFCCRSHATIGSCSLSFVWCKVACGVK